MKYGIAIALTLVALVTSGYCTDDNRKGWVEGIGLGFAPVSRFTLPEGSNLSEDAPAFGYSLLLGYGWSEHDVTAFEFNGTVRNSSYYSEIGEHTEYFFESGLHGSQYIYQHLGGVTWYHYFGVPGKSFLTVVGVGLFNLGTKNLGSNESGLGTLAGLGHEFARHFQTVFYWTRGQSSDGWITMKHSQLSILVSWIRY